MAVNALERWRTRFNFAVRQSGRVAWYAGHGAIVRRITRRLEDEAPQARRPVRAPSRPVPTMRRLLADVGLLLRRDLANAERGHYPVPEADEDGSLPKIFARSRAFLRDVPKVVRRKQRDLRREVAEAAPEGSRSSPKWRACRLPMRASILRPASTCSTSCRRRSASKRRARSPA